MDSKASKMLSHILIFGALAHPTRGPHRQHWAFPRASIFLGEKWDGAVDPERACAVQPDLRVQARGVCRLPVAYGALLGGKQTHC